jgi:hypothetical protein
MTKGKGKVKGKGKAKSPSFSSCQYLQPGHNIDFLLSFHSPLQAHLLSFDCFYTPLRLH